MRDMTHDHAVFLTVSLGAIGCCALLGLFVVVLFFRSLGTTRRNRNHNNVPGGPRA